MISLDIEAHVVLQVSAVLSNEVSILTAGRVMLHYRLTIHTAQK